jgi:hypothetical protein
MRHSRRPDADQCMPPDRIVGEVRPWFNKQRPGQAALKWHERCKLRCSSDQDSKDPNRSCPASLVTKCRIFLSTALEKIIMNVTRHNHHQDADSLHSLRATLVVKIGNLHAQGPRASRSFARNPEAYAPDVGSLPMRGCFRWSSDWGR